MMSEQNPYERLGVPEDASFDEIQDARNRLMMECESDRKQRELIEAAYDAVLMDRLRLRQEGKIKVPDRIRFPEQLAQPVPNFAVPATAGTPAWLQRWIDTPSREDILQPAVLFLVLSGVIMIFPGSNGSSTQVALAIGIIASLYFLTRKENKFGRALLLTLIGLVLGLVAGWLVTASAAGILNGLTIPPLTISAVIAMFVLWLVNSFLR